MARLEHEMAHCSLLLQRTRERERERELEREKGVCVCECVLSRFELFEGSRDGDLLPDKSPHDSTEDLVEAAAHVLGHLPSISLLQFLPTHSTTHIHNNRL